MNDGGGGACECPSRGCLSIFRMVDDVTQAKSKGVGACECPSRGCLSIFLRVDDVTQAKSKGGACECSEGRG